MIHPVEYKKSIKAVEKYFFVFRVHADDQWITATTYERSGMGIQFKTLMYIFYKIQSVVHKLTQIATAENI